MALISHVVQKLINERPFILEAMGRGIVSYGSLAEKLKSEVEEELGREVKQHAIVMALRRHAEEIKKHHKKISFDYSSDVILKTNICDISVLRSNSLLIKLKKIYDVINFEIGDFLNMIHGRYEVSIITHERYKENLIQFLKGEKILNLEEGLVTLTLTFPKEFFHTPGVVFNILRSIAWENINIYEIVSTNTELTLILNKKDATRGYKTLERLIIK